MKKYIALAAFLVAGCGGSTGPLSVSSSEITGTAATGLAISGGGVRGHCKNGIADTTTNADGSYSLTLPSGVSKPCLIRVVSGATTLYSAIHENQTIANITPITNMIVANALGDDPANAFTNAANGSLPVALTEQNITSAKTVVATVLTSLGITMPNGVDPLASGFVATSGTKTGDDLDIALDRLGTVLTNANVSIAQASVAIKAATKDDAANKIQEAAPVNTTIARYSEPSAYTSVPSDAVTVLLAANGYITKSVTGGSENIPSSLNPAITTPRTSGLLGWTSKDAVASVYFYVSTPGLLQIGLQGDWVDVGSPGSTLKLKVRGQTFDVSLSSASSANIAVGTVNIPTAGYVKVDLQGVTRSGSTFGNVQSLKLSGAASANLVFVKTTNGGNEPYQYAWRKQGASLYVNYTLPSGKSAIKYFYNEVTIPVGYDPTNTYFAVSGFTPAGYFGIQVKDPRWVIFSVWNPNEDTCAAAKAAGNTASKCATTLVTGAGVTATTFGGEGTGAKTYMPYAWVAGKTYKFILKAEASGTTTKYTAWFFDPDGNSGAGKWFFIATISYPGTSVQYLDSLYSFNESWTPTTGFPARKMILSNQWVATDDAGTQWTEMKNGSYSGDTYGALSGERLDYAGGLTDDPNGGTNNAYYLMAGYLDINGVGYPNVLLTQSASRKYLTRGASGAGLDSVKLKAIVDSLPSN